MKKVFRLLSKIPHAGIACRCLACRPQRRRRKLKSFDFFFIFILSFYRAWLGCLKRNELTICSLYSHRLFFARTTATTHLAQLLQTLIKKCAQKVLLVGKAPSKKHVCEIKKRIREVCFGDGLMIDLINLAIVTEAICNIV